MSTPSLSDLREAAAALILDWARAALPHYGPGGSMDLDLHIGAIPEAAGPSYYNQFAHWPLLMLSEGLLPGAGEEERLRMRACALGNIEYLLGITDADFTTPHFSLGRDWGRHVGEWSIYYLMKSQRLMRDQATGTRDLGDRLERNVRGAVASIHRSFLQAHGPSAAPPRVFPGNHATWHALLLVEAGMRFSEAAWVGLGRHFFHTRVLPFQGPSGCWPEGGGIVVNYAMVTAQALSIYAELTGDPAAAAALARFLSFLRFFTLPDGSSAVVADCRQRYHARPMIFLPLQLARFPEGRADCLRRIRGFHEHLRSEGVKPLGVQGLAFFANVAHSLLREPSGGDQAAIGYSPAASVAGIEAARLEAGPWTAFISWQLVPETPSRWILDTQGYVEIHHRESGYLVGGGNSKYMPRFSTLRRMNAGRAYVPERAAPLDSDGRGARVAYHFGSDVIEVALTTEAERVEVGFRVSAQGESEVVYEAALMLDVRPGETIRCDDREYLVDPFGLIEHAFPVDGTIAWRGRVLQVPGGSTLTYPLVPHNPYRQDGLPSVESYAARVAVDIGAAAKVFRLL